MPTTDKSTPPTVAPDRGVTPASGSTPPARTGGQRQGGAGSDDDDEWRHAPVAPRDESNPLKSLGEAIADVATGSEKATAAGRDVKKPPPAR